MLRNSNSSLVVDKGYLEAIMRPLRKEETKEVIIKQQTKVLLNGYNHKLRLLIMNG